MWASTQYSSMDIHAHNIPPILGSILTICKYNIHGVRYMWASPYNRAGFRHRRCFEAAHLVVVGGLHGTKASAVSDRASRIGLLSNIVCIVDGVSKTGWTHIIDIVIGGRM